MEGARMSEVVSKNFFGQDILETLLMHDDAAGTFWGDATNATATTF